MKTSLKYFILLFFSALVLFQPITARAEPLQQITPDLYIREVKVTGEEFVVLQANADIPDLSEYWLGYSSNELAVTVVPTQQLPARALLANQAIVLTSDGSATCDAVWITKLSVSLGDTRGVLMLRRLTNAGASSTFTTVDNVNWAKPSASGTTTAQLDLRKETASLTYPVWYQDKAHTPSWRVGNMEGCTLRLTASPTQPVEEVSWEVEAEEPLAIIESLTDEQLPENAVETVAANVGLAPPQITELLPNPVGTGTDGTDEYIELYNSNDHSFNLGGFKLQTGTTTKHTYTFPAGTTLPAKGFRAFYAGETGLSMSNTGSQAALLDQTGAEISKSEAYTSAKDGMAWALAQGSWYWTNRLTPNDTNVIVQVTPSVLAATTKKASSILATAAKATKKATTTAKTPKAKKTATAKKTKATTSPKTSTSIASAAAKPAPIHWSILAVVALGALGYGLYGYRHDMANKYHDFRANRSARRAHRS
ncbi:MAG: lamin tail domain-containing protein [Candidatus Saccharimonadales bacterium]